MSAFLFIISSFVVYAQNELPNDGITSPIHKKYIGKIVFTSSLPPLKFAAENEGAFVTKFELGTPIFFRVYMANSLFNYINKLVSGQKREDINSKGSYMIKFYLDNVEVYYANACAGTSEFNAKEQEEMTTFKGALRNPDERGIGEVAFDRFIYKAMPKLSKGDHNVKVELYPTINSPQEATGSVVATGEFTLAVSESYANFFAVSYTNFAMMKTSKDFNGNKIAVDNNGKTITTYTKGSNNGEVIVKDNNGNIIHTESLDFNGNTSVKTINGTLLGTFKKDFNGKLEFVEVK